jgi:hypothetical protein
MAMLVFNFDKSLLLISEIVSAKELPLKIKDHIIFHFIAFSNLCTASC